MNTTRTLIAPIKVYAVYQEEDRAVVGPEMDFESLPYFDRTAGLDMNPDVPYLAESVIPRPFADTDFLLRQGVHLQWDFPRFLRRTRHGANSAIEFPPVPTRWLVSRFAADSSTPDRQWIVESDALLDDLQGAAIYDMAQTSVETNIYSGDRPYTYMGRTALLDEWLRRQGKRDDRFTSWKDKHGGKPLTALGWGSPSFDIFYPNCRGVFGLHDPSGTPQHRYRVVGWYEDLADDYWLFYLRAKEGGWGFAEIEAISHLTADRKAALKTEQFTKQLRDDLGVEIQPGAEFAAADQWQRMVCCGESEYLDDLTLAKDQTLFAVGNTPIEALSALIAEKVVGAGDELERAMLEDSISAMLMGDRLKSQKLDIGPKFREFRHADEFVGSSGGLQWVIEQVDDNPQKTPQGEPPKDHALPPPLPEHLLPFLHALNDAQREYDRTARELESWRLQLYADWYRYMHAAYPPPGETEEYAEVSDLRALMRAGALAEVKRLKAAVGGRKQDDHSGLAARIEAAGHELQRELDAINDRIAADARYVEKFHWEVQHRPAPRFWEPAPPALVIAIPRNSPGELPADSQPPPNQDPARSAALNAPLACATLSEGDAAGLEFSPAGFSVAALFRPGAVQWAAKAKGLSTDLPIFRGEWEVEVFPVAAMHPVTRSSGRYDPQFMLHNYLLGENEPDLVVHPQMEGHPALTRAGSIYSGSAYVNQNLDDRYRDLLQRFRDLQATKAEALRTEVEKQRLESFLANVQLAEAFLDQHDLLVITLNGFHSALLQRHESIQLNPADPLGFADDRAFAQEVAAALEANFKGLSPDPHAPFMPVRSGALRVSALRLVDRFGRFVELIPTDVSTALSMTVPDNPDWVRLPPRLCQPARWNFRFLQAGAESPTESTSHASSTPVHGWIIPNLLDGSLDFFDPNGQRLGSLGQRVRQNGDRQSVWTADGANQLTGAMKQIRDWMAGKPAKFLAALMEDIEEAMDNIHPDDRGGGSAFSVLMGRPMAVVQLGVELELEGLPAANNSWADLYRALQVAARATDDFDQVKFPYRLGEYRQRNDGLVGYWVIEDGALSAAFRVSDSISGALNIEKIRGYVAGSEGPWLEQKNQEWRIHDVEGRTLFEFLLAEEDATIKKQDLIQPYTREGSRVWSVLRTRGYLAREARHNGIRHYADSGMLNISPADPMQQFIALVDPHGLIHLSSGIQPVKAIQLPEQFVRNALSRIEMTFLVAPVLTPEDEMQLSLPKEQAFNWAWREANSWPSQACETPGAVEIAGAEIRAFRPAASFPARVVLREGWLVLKQTPENQAQPPSDHPDQPNNRQEP